MDYKFECNPGGAWVCDLSRLSQAIAQQTDPARILQEILENIVDRFDAGSGSLAMAISGGSALTIVGGIAIPPAAFGQTIMPGQGVIGWVAENKQALLLSGDLSQDPRFTSHAGKRTSPRPYSAMCWPLLIEERLIGVLSLNRKQEDPPFTEADMERVEQSVAMVTVIVENARLHQDQQQRMDALAQANVRMVLLSEVLSKFLRNELQVAGQEELHDFYHELLSDVRSITDAEHSSLGITDANGQIGEMFAVGSDAIVSSTLGCCLTLRKLIGDVSLDGKAKILFPDKEKDLRICMPAGYPSIDCILVVPMILQGKCCGALTVLGKQHGDSFDDSDELSIGLIANNLAMLLERIGLMNNLKQSKDALEKEKEEQKALINKLQEAQNQLLQSEKMASIGQLAAGVAHEINNPVGYVASNLGSLGKYIRDLFTLLDTYNTAEPLLAAHPETLATIRAVKEQVDIGFLKQDIEELVGESLEGVNRVKQIVQDLKDFSHVDQSEWQWADLHKGLDSTLNVARNEIRYKAEVVKNFDAIPQVECLASQLNQVFMNLMVNAAHAIEDRGVITVSTGRVNDEVWVEVRDNGKGIAQENLKRIFDPFFTTKPVGKGTGLGLSLAYGIIQKHKGRIEVESGVGKGTSFRVWLPIERADKGNKDASDRVQGAA